MFYSEFQNYIQQYRADVQDKPRNERKHIYVIGGYFQSRTGSVYRQIDEDSMYQSSLEFLEALIFGVL